MHAQLGDVGASVQAHTKHSELPLEIGGGSVGGANTAAWLMSIVHNSVTAHDTGSDLYCEKRFLVVGLLVRLSLGSSAALCAVISSSVARNASIFHGVVTPPPPAPHLRGFLT